MVTVFTRLTASSLHRLGTILGSLCKPGDIICLGGELGAGKTTLTQAIARGAGIDEQECVCSPTFAFMHEYKGIFPIYHMDFYRLGSSDDVLETGLDEYFYQPGISLIEWYERAGDLIPKDHLLVRLEIIDQNNRNLRLSSPTSHWHERITILERKFHGNP